MIDRIVITGNIGTGKSAVTKVFKKFGYHIISADEISAIILEKNQQKVSNMFGMRPTNFNTFKKELGQLIFADKASRCMLEDYMLPKINADIDLMTAWLDEYGEKYVVEMPTFFETRGLKLHEGVIVINVFADKALRVKRVMNRNKHLAIQDVLDRMNAQIDPEAKKDYSFFNIENNGDLESLEAKVINIIKVLEL